MNRLVAYTLLTVCIGIQNSTAPAIAAETSGGSRVAKAFRALEDEQELKAALTSEEDADNRLDSAANSGLKLATFGNGCFWCTEAVFQELHGVKRVVSGYSGGRVNNPTYKQVCTGRTGHAEVIHLQYDPKVISFGKLLEVFWRTHDPTTLNRQGNDVGPQYRSAVFYHDETQKKIATHYKDKLNEAKAFRKPVVTEVTKFKKFYPAERYHQDYFLLNGRAPYCRAVIKPKLSKFRRVFSDELARNPKNAAKKTATASP